MRAVVALGGVLVLVLSGVPTPSADPGAASQVVLAVECHLPPVRMMEFSYSNPTCWNHSGIHTYFLGPDTTWLLRGVTGLAFTVEQEFSVPTEDPAVVLTPGPLNAGIHSPVLVEVSLDGRAWDLAGSGRYRWLDLDETLDCLLPCVRQDVLFDFAGAGQEFRFLRVRQPYSEVTQGLSGFLDHTRLQVRVDPGSPVAPAALAPGSRDLPCTAALEAGIDPDHPCWFGGLDRYDSPSFFHTWFLGEASLDRVSFNATVLPWRSDDFFSPLPVSARLPRLPRPLAQPLPWLADLQADPAGTAGATANDTLRFAGDLAAGPPMTIAGLEQRLRTNVTLQASVDGQAWVDLLRVYGPYAQPIGGAVDLAGVPAKFLRLVPEKHYRYDEFNAAPPLHHPRGFLLDSDLHVQGRLAPAP